MVWVNNSYTYSFRIEFSICEWRLRTIEIFKCNYCKKCKNFSFINFCILNMLLIDSCIRQHTTWKVSKYGVISGPYFPVFSPNTWKYWAEITPHLDTLHAVSVYLIVLATISKLILFYVGMLTYLRPMFNFTEAYFQPYQTSSMECFAKIVNGYKPLTVFAKMLHGRCLIEY